MKISSLLPLLLLLTVSMIVSSEARVAERSACDQLDKRSEDEPQGGGNPSFRPRGGQRERNHRVRRNILKSVSNVLQTPFEVVSKVVDVPFDVASTLVQAVKPLTGDGITDVAQKHIDVWSDVFQLPIGLGSDFAKLPFELIANLGEDENGRGGLGCCVDVPHLNEMMEEVEILHSHVSNCSTMIGQLVVSVTGVRQKRGFFSSDSALFNIITKPISIASNVAQLPFKVLGEGVKIPLKIAGTVVNVASPLLGERLTSILSVPLNTLNKFAQLPFEIGAEFIQMPFELADSIAKLPFGSQEEAAAAKYCCGRMTLVNQMFTSTQELRQAAQLCDSQLEQVVSAVEKEIYGY